jgi:hypothetical protein
LELMTSDTMNATSLSIICWRLEPDVLMKAFL